jgi:hypothetical protein
LAAGQSLAQPEPNYAREQEIAQMGEVTPNVAADFDPVLGTPTFIRSTTAYVTRRSTRTPAQVVADFVSDNPATFGVSLGGGALTGAAQFPVAEFRVIRDFVTPTLGPTGVRHLTYQQQHNGQDIYGSILTANVTGDGMLVNISSRFVATPQGAAAITPPNCGARNTVAAACDAMDDARIADITNLIDPNDDCTTDWTVGHAYHGVGETALYVQCVLHPVSATELVQAWVVRLPSNPVQDDAAWECIVKHSDLSVIDHYDRTMRYCQPDPATFRVYPSDSPRPGSPGLARQPNFGEAQDTEYYFTPSERVLVTRSVTATGDPSPGGWINDAHYATCVTGLQIPDDVPISVLCGNNVVVRYVDGAPPFPGSDRLFDFGLATQLPEAVATQAFVVANEWHDRMYVLGFNEVAGNCQAYNRGLGGEESDPVTIIIGGDFWPGSTTATRGEYQDGRTMTSKFAAALNGAELRHTALDRHIVYHELSHILTSRLHVGTVSESAGNLANGMWEGWGEYFGVALTHQSGDDVYASYPPMPWSSRPTFEHTLHYFFGNSLYPITPVMRPVADPLDRFANNPVTYGLCDLGDTTTGATPPLAYPQRAAFPPNPRPTYYPIGQRASNPPLVVRDKYRIGEVWTAALIQCRAHPSDHIGQNGAPIGGDAANDLLLQLVVDGMKLDPGGPKFIDARDAILQADLLRYGGVHQPSLWEGFRERGLGWGARQPRPRDGASAPQAILDVNRGRFLVQDFLLPPAAAISVFFPDDEIRLISTCNETEFDVLIVSPASPLTEVVSDAEERACPLGLPRPLSAQSPGHYRFMTRPAPCGNSWVLKVTARNALPGGIVDKRLTVVAGVESAPVVFNMEQVLGWVGTPAVPSVFRMERVDPNGRFLRPSKDATPGAGRLCWVTQDRTDFVDSSPDIDDVDPGGDGVLKSSAITVVPNKPVLVEMHLWYARRSGASQDVECEVEWQPSGDSPPTAQSKVVPAADSGQVWRVQRFVFGSGHANTGTLRIRFTDPADDTAVEGGVDDVRVSVITACAQCCDADMNLDGNNDQDDVSTLIRMVAGEPVPCGIEPDFNHDGNVDQDDVLALISYIGGDPCPF